MRWTATIEKDGTKVVSEVIDRQDSICGNIKKVTNAVGTELSDEHIGPECDRVEEIQGGGGSQS